VVDLIESRSHRDIQIYLLILVPVVPPPVDTLQIPQYFATNPDFGVPLLNDHGSNMQFIPVRTNNNVLG
jgi:hypothetical protein